MEQQEEQPEVPAKGGVCGPKVHTRMLVAILTSVGMGLIYGLKVGLHVVIVTMVNNTAVAAARADPAPAGGASGCEDAAAANHSEKVQDGPFAWNADVEGWLLSSYFYGYMLSELPGGIVSEKFSAKWVFLLAVFLNIVCVFLSPVMSGLHWGGLLAMRVLQGVGGGMTFPAAHVLLAHWAPPSERGVLGNIVYAGTSLGTVIFMLGAGQIAGALGWEAAFYIEGGIATIWLFFWFWLAADTPQKQKYITPEERAFIVESLQVGEEHHPSKHHPSVPWKKVLTSMPFMAILIAHTCNNWGWYLVLIELPQYMSKALRFKISDNAILTAMPFFLMWVFSMILSAVMDYLRKKDKLSLTWMRKICTLIASVIPALCMLGLCFIECNRNVAVALMTIAVTTSGGIFTGFLSNHIDIAPNFAGTLMAITNTIATIPGIVVPIAIGRLLQADPTINSWRIIFYITIALYLIEIIVYTIFGTGEIQPWNDLE